MTEVTTGEQQSTDKVNEAMSLSEAVRIVREAITAEENRLKGLTNSEEAAPVMLEGETSTGYYAQMMVNPAKVAKIMLDYQYPLYRVLREDVPQEMWDELARMAGLDDVCSVDL